MAVKFKKSYGGREKYFPHKTKRDEADAGDCSFRAVAIALDKDYLEVWNEMYEYGKDNGFLPNDDRVIDYILNKNGFFRNSPMVDRWNCKYILNKVPIDVKKTYVFRMAGHLLTVKDGIYYDIHNCAGHKVFSYYTKKQ